MSPLHVDLTHTVMRMLHLSGVNAAFARVTRPRGAILMLHRVVNDTTGASDFHPNVDFAVSVRYLHEMISFLRTNGWDIVTLDEALGRLKAAVPQRRFAVFTFDDGYRDNLELALPVFRDHGAPFTVYATTGFLTRQYLPWWYVAEAALSRVTELDIDVPGLVGPRRCSSDAERRQLFLRLRAAMMGLPPHASGRVCDDLLVAAGLDRREFADALMLDPDGLRELAQHAEVTLGAHAHSHSVLAVLADAQLDVEFGGSCRLIESWIGRGVRHYCYPFGGIRECGTREVQRAAACGFTTATTTRKAVVKRPHAEQPLALPRVAVRGSQQRLDLLSLQLSGLVPAVNRLWQERVRLLPQ